jgi:hypothetical protein
MRLSPLLLLAATLTALVATSAWAQPRASGPDPVLAQWPDWTQEVSCNGPEEAVDPLVAFARPTIGETGSGPGERALRRVIKEQRNWAEPLVSGEDWRLIAETETHAQFTRGRLTGTLEWVGLERDEEGRWGFASYASDCDPAVLVEDRTVVSWSLSSRQKRLTPHSRTLWIQLGAGECASGAPQNPRAGFRFRTLGKNLLMIASLKPIGRGGTCIGTIEPPRKVRLPVPLGDLRLYDGSVFPPVPAGKTRSAYY